MKLSSEIEKIFFTTIRIETRDEAGGKKEGTAFVFEYKTEDNNYPFLVTAKRTVKAAVEGRMTLMLSADGKPLLGKGYTLDIDNFERLWYMNADAELDIAVTPFVPFVKHIEASGTAIYFRALGPEFLLSPADPELLGVGDDIVFVTYPHGLWDRKHMLPVLRKGMVSTSLGGGFQGKKQFLIDAQVAIGSAGSPVFFLSTMESNFAMRDAEMRKIRRPILLGMLVNAQLSTPDENNVDGPVVAEDMGVVISTEIVLETITNYLREKGFI